MTAPRRAAGRAGRGGREPGLGDRWMAGERLPDVAYGLHDAVQVTDGPYLGGVGRVLLLAAPPPDVAYLVALDAAAGPVRIAQTALRPAS